MTHLTTWRNDLKQHLREFAPLAKEDRSIDLIYGITAAAVLWGVRDAPNDAIQLEALHTACGDEKYLELLKRALGGWDMITPLEAARNLGKRQSQLPELRDALSAVLAYFLDDLFAEKVLQPTITVAGDVSGANVLIGSTQVVAGDLVIQHIQPKAERTCPNPPSLPDKFGGREERLQEIMARIKAGNDTAITAMHGLGGIGKTTLARVLAHRLHADKTFRAVLWADVTRDPNVTGILSDWVIAHADSAFDVGAFESVTHAALAAKRRLDTVIEEKCETCDPPRVLVVLDDVWDNGLETARTLRDACPEHSTILITTRSENIAHNLEAAPESLTYMTPDEAVGMLALYLPEADPHALRRLGVALGGHALAMELAARRVQKEKRPGESDFQKLERCIRDYETGIPAGSPFDGLKLEQGENKDDNLTRSLAHSYEDLDTDDDRRRFRALGVLAYDAPFDAALLAALWELPLDAVYDAADRLRLLSLLEMDGDGYRQHPLLRAYARALLDAENEANAAFDLYADHVITIAGQFGPLPLEEWHALTPDLPHIHAVGDALAERWQASPAAPDEALTARAAAFAYNITRYVSNRPQMIDTPRGRERLGLRWLELGLAISRQTGDQKREALFCNELGSAWDALGEKRKALEFYEQALSLSRAVGDRGGEAATLNNIGLAWSALGEKRKALDFFEQALPLSRAVGDLRGEATALNNIGGAWSALSEKRKALEFYEQALPLSRAVGDLRGEATTLNNIGGA